VAPEQTVLRQDNAARGSVEVLLVDTADRWYVTKFIGLAQPGSATVEWQNRELVLPTSRVRLPTPPKLVDPEEEEEERPPFRPSANDAVEVLLPATASKPPSYVSGSVRVVRGPYFLVSLQGQGRQEDRLVQAAQLREPGRTVVLSALTLQEAVLECPPGVRCSGDGQVEEWLVSVQQQCNLLCLQLNQTTSAFEAKLVGERNAVSLAGKLLHCVHFWNRGEMDRCRAHQKQLECRLSCLEGESREEGKIVEIAVDHDIMQLVIGRSGKRLKDIKEQLDVDIEVLRSSVRGARQVVVRVVGQDPAAVLAAKRQLEFQRQIFSFPQGDVGFVLGKNLTNIRDIAEKAGLLSLRFEPHTQALELVGLPEHLESARMVIEAHMDYKKVYSDMRQEHGALTRSFQALDAEMRKRGKGAAPPAPRQNRARTPPPTARMLAAGRLQKPGGQAGSLKGRGAKGASKGPPRPPPGWCSDKDSEAELVADESIPKTQARLDETPELDEDSDASDGQGAPVPAFLFQTQA